MPLSLPRRKEPEITKKTLNAAEAATYLGVCWRTLMKTILPQGELSYRRAGRRFLFTVESLDRYLNRESAKD